MRLRFERYGLHFDIVAESALIVDMMHAGTGKKCSAVRFSGWVHDVTDCTRTVMQMLRSIEKFKAPDAVRDPAGHLTPQSIHDWIRKVIKETGPVNGVVDCCMAYVNGTDAPVPTLTAGVEGVWSAMADENGIAVNDLTDKHNEPAAITHRQKSSAAYKAARKCWGEVEKCATFHQACEVLRRNGAKLHSYCRVD